MQKLVDLTLNNPFFITASILFIWFAPGIVVRGIAEKRHIKEKEEAQAKKIAKLYPKSNGE